MLLLFCPLQNSSDFSQISFNSLALVCNSCGTTAWDLNIVFLKPSTLLRGLRKATSDSHVALEQLFIVHAGLENKVRPFKRRFTEICENYIPICCKKHKYSTLFLRQKLSINLFSYCLCIQSPSLVLNQQKLL